MTIPPELMEQAAKGNILLFVGERVVHDSRGRIFLDKVKDELARRIGGVDVEKWTFPQVAQEYENGHGKQALISLVREQLEAAGGDAPEPIHRLAAQLSNCQVFVTTCVDERLERAFDVAGRPPIVIVNDADVPFEDTQKAQLYRLRGTLGRPDSVVLTEADFERFWTGKDVAQLVAGLKSLMARRTIVFIGYDLGDPHFRQFFHEAVESLDRPKLVRRSYVLFDEAPPSPSTSWCERHEIDVMVGDPAVWLQELGKAKRTEPEEQPEWTPPTQTAGQASESLLRNPYKFFDFFEEKDQTLFRGREREAWKLASLIRSHRCVILYGGSGVGKTSLLLAGVTPLLESSDPFYRPVYVRVRDDPAKAIRGSVRQLVDDRNHTDDITLSELLSTTSTAIGHPLVIMLDQFEQFFVRSSDQGRKAFIAELVDLYYKRDIPTKVIISVRAEWLASLEEISTELQAILPSMRLLPLSAKSARQAILAPAESVEVGFEPGLVHELLKQLVGAEGTTVFPPHLQLACHVLYDARDPQRQLITHAAYEGLGRLEGILNRHLDEQLRTLPSGPDRDWAHRVLEDLISLSQTTESKSIEEIALSLHTTVSQVRPVVDKLISAGLVRDVEVEDGSTAYELAHEYLISRITLTSAALARKEAEELIKADLDAWKRYGVLMSSEQYELVNARREHLPLTPERSELMLRCAIRHNRDICYWVGALGAEEAMEIITSVLSGAVPQVRSEDRIHAIQAAIYLPSQMCRSLLYESAESQDDVVAAEARSLLTEHMDQEAVEDFYDRYATGSEEERKRALQVLAGIDTPLATERLASILADQGQEERLDTIHLVAQGRAADAKRLLARAAVRDSDATVREKARELLLRSASAPMVRELFDLAVPITDNYRIWLRKAISGGGAWKTVADPLALVHNRAIQIAGLLSEPTSVDALVDAIEAELGHRPKLLKRLAGCLSGVPLVCLFIPGLQVLGIFGFSFGVLMLLLLARCGGSRPIERTIDRIHGRAAYLAGREGGHEYLLAQSIPPLLFLASVVLAAIISMPSRTMAIGWIIAGIASLIYMAFTGFAVLNALFPGSVSKRNVSWFVAGPGRFPIRCLTADTLVHRIAMTTILGSLKRKAASSGRDFPIEVTKYLLRNISDESQKAELLDLLKALFAQTSAREIDDETWYALGSLLGNKEAAFVNDIARKESQRPASRYRRQAEMILTIRPGIRPRIASRFRRFVTATVRIVLITLMLVAAMMVLYLFLSRNGPAQGERTSQITVSGQPWQVYLYEGNYGVLWISGDKQLRRLDLDSTGGVLSASLVVTNTDVAAFGCSSSGVFCVLATQDRVGVLKDGDLRWGTLPDRWSNRNGIWASDETPLRLWLQAGSTFYASTDMGATWSPTSDNMEIPDISGDRAEAPEPQSQAVFVQGGYLSGAELGLDLPSRELEHDILLEPGRPAVLLAVGSRTPQIRYSAPELAWQRAQVPWNDADPQICGAQYSSLLANTNRATPVLYRHYTLLDGEEGILMSKDRGQEWMKIPLVVASPLGRQFLVQFQPCANIERLKQLVGHLARPLP